MSDQTAVTEISSSGGVRGENATQRRRSRRAREVRLDDEMEGASLAKIAKTMGFSHAKSTKQSYSSYHNSINEWFNSNNPETCDEYRALSAADTTA